MVLVDPEVSVSMATVREIQTNSSEKERYQYVLELRCSGLIPRGLRTVLNKSPPALCFGHVAKCT